MFGGSELFVDLAWLLRVVSQIIRWGGWLHNCANVDNCLHVVGQFAFEMDVLACGGMYKSEAAGMQRMARQLLKTVLDKLFVFGKCSALEDAVSAVTFIIK